MGILCCLFERFLQPCPSRFGEWIHQIPLKSFNPHLKTSEKLSWRLWAEGFWMDCFVGSWTSFGFPRETVEISPLFPSAARPHAAIFPPSLCTGMGSCLSLVLSTSLAISLPIPSCSLLLPSFFSRWSLVWFPYPVAFTWWCFGCSRGKQVSILYVFIISQIKKLMN